MKTKQKQFTMKMDETTRQRLELLSNNPIDKYNLSKTLRGLITKAFERYEQNND